MHGRTERRTRGGHGVPGDFTGRHRGPGRLPGPVGVATAVTLLLVMVGVGAAVLPVGLAGTPAPQSPVNDAGATPTGADGIGILGDASTPSAWPTTATPPSASANPTTAIPPSASAKPTTTPSRTTSPTSPRTPSGAPTATSGGADSHEEQVVEIVNSERVANGCDTVTVNAKLADSARLHSQDQAAHDKMSHVGSDGSSFVDRARAAGYASPIGENVAMGYPTPGAVMDAWMNSQGHRANILNCGAQAIGVGIAANADGRLYWTQVFGAVV